MNRQIIKNLISNYMLTGIGMILGFFLLPFLIRKLGHEGFGVTVVAEALIAFFFVFVSAIRIAVSRYVTLSLSQEKTEDCLLYLSTGRRILHILMVVSLLLGVILAILFPVFFKVPANLHHQSQVMFLLIVISFVLSIPNVVYWAILYGYQRFDLINISNAGGTILRAVAIFTLYSFLSGKWASLGAYGMVYFVMTMGQNYIVYRWAMSLMPSAARIGFQYDLPKAAEILLYTRYTVMATVSSTLYGSVVPVIINIFCGPMANTIFAVASRIPGVLSSIFLQPAWSLVPTCTHYVGRNERDKVERLFFMYSKGTLIVFCPLIFSVAVCSRMILHWWVGDGFNSAIVVMMILSAGTLLGSFGFLSSVVTSAYGEIKIPTIVGIVSAFLSIGLGVVFAFFFKMGLPGLAMGGLLITLGGAFCFSPIYACHILKADVKKYYKESFFIPILLTVFSFGWEILFQSDIHFSLRFFCLAALGTIFYLWLVLRWAFNESEKRDILSLFKGRLAEKIAQGA